MAASCSHSESRRIGPETSIRTRRSHGHRYRSPYTWTAKSVRVASCSRIPTAFMCRRSRITRHDAPGSRSEPMGMDADHRRGDCQSLVRQLQQHCVRPEIPRPSCSATSHLALLRGRERQPLRQGGDPGVSRGIGLFSLMPGEWQSATLPSWRRHRSGPGQARDRRGNTRSQTRRKLGRGSPGGRVWRLRRHL